MRRAISAALVVLLAAWGAQAQDGQVDHARKLFQAGAQAYAVGQYSAAIQAFEQAYALAPRSAVVFSIAQAERRQYFAERNPAYLERAIAHFRQYVTEVPQGGRFADAVQALSELEPMASQLRQQQDANAPSGDRATTDSPTRLMVTSSADGARIRLDGGVSRSSPFIEVVAPGRHTIVAEAGGYFPERRDVVAIRNELVAVDLPLRERPGNLLVVAPEGAQLTIDGRVQGNAPFEQALELPAGTHRITLARSGFVGLSDEVVIKRGETTVVKARMPRSTQRTISYLMMGGGVSTLVAAGVFAWFSRDRDNAASDFLAERGASRLGPDDLQQYESARIDRDRLRTAAQVSLGASLALGVTGGLLYAMESPTVDASSRARPGGEARKPEGQSRLQAVRVMPVAARGFIGLGLQGSAF